MEDNRIEAPFPKEFTETCNILTRYVLLITHTWKEIGENSTHMEVSLNMMRTKEIRGHSGGDVVPHDINNSGSLVPKKTEELLDLLGQWDSLLRSQQRARALILKDVSKLTHELGVRGVVDMHMSTTVSTIRQDYRALDQDINNMMKIEVRPSNTQPKDRTGINSSIVRPSNVGAGHSHSTGLGLAYHSIIGTSQSATVNPSGSAPAGARMPLRTEVCGRVIPPPTNPLGRPERRSKQDTSQFKFRCVICNEAFRDHRRVYTHFPACVKRNGNPNGASWYDDASIDEANLPDGVLEEN
ncbi:MAG: hypothetical protein ASARMPREDX12_003993 [Alectoria sarmentosa]|nr:MAG: hypothetical protein ASARMPREDX12_003993 [Alectoria sarmentosa]